MSTFEQDSLRYQRTNSDQSNASDLSYAGVLLEHPSGQEWQQDPLLQALFLPDDFVQYSDKHVLLNTEIDEHDSKRQEKTHEPEKKKPGRKPILNEPTTKRKQQNRAAQRAFRERKESHVNALEARVAQLEQQNNDQSMENQYLKAQLSHLRGLGSKDSFADMAAFTFDFPAPQTYSSLSPAAGSIHSSRAIPAQSDCPSLSSSNTSPQTAIGKDFNAAAMPRFARHESYPDSSRSSIDSAMYPLTGSIQSMSAVLRPTSDSSLLFSESFLAQPLNVKFDATSYRDTKAEANTFDIDPPLYDEMGIFELQHQFDGSQLPGSLALFDEFSPVILDQVTLEQQPELLTDTEETSGVVVLSPVEASALEAEGITLDKQASACPEIWRKIVAHPKFGAFDLDELCTMFEKKNQCSEIPGPGHPDFKPDWTLLDRRLDEFAELHTKKDQC